jgi:hypothetical protein
VDRDPLCIISTKKFGEQVLVSSENEGTVGNAQVSRRSRGILVDPLRSDLRGILVIREDCTLDFPRDLGLLGEGVGATLGRSVGVGLDGGTEIDVVLRVLVNVTATAVRGVAGNTTEVREIGIGAIDGLDVSSATLGKFEVDGNFESEINVILTAETVLTVVIPVLADVANAVSVIIPDFEMAASASTVSSSGVTRRLGMVGITTVTITTSMVPSDGTLEGKTSSKTLGVGQFPVLDLSEGAAS